VDEEAVKAVRPFIVCCVVRQVDLKDGKLRSFIQAQTRLHESVCAKRVAATIATHDLAKVKGKTLVYTARSPQELKILPLGKVKEVDAATLVAQLKAEAEHLRKEKKRSTVSGVHQYLSLLGDKAAYACLQDEQGKVISFPPITNGETTKIGEETQDVLIEVTSDVKLQTAKDVADAVLKEMLKLGLGKKMKVKKEDGDFYSSSEDEDASETTPQPKQLLVEQVKVIDSGGNLRVVYPSKTDLSFNDVNVKRA